MVMITFLGASVKEYLDCYGEKSPDFPADCPICGSVNLTGTDILTDGR
ncbi:hypothetical protein [Thermincola potens]|nr:hypothetical protein [Thermincola potens]